jgi:putative addiction module component (TIGR02574 family)
MSETQTAELDTALRELMKFTPEQRMELAERLLDSIPPIHSDREVEQAWNEEISRRVQELDEGKVKLIPAEEVHARIESMLKKLKQSAE